MKITLSVNGRERSFSEKELIVILEKHFSNEGTGEAVTENVVQAPTEGKWFEVNPLEIDQSLFREERKNVSQEETRKLILEAFVEVKSNPEKYGKKFKTLIPNKTWKSKTVAELKQLACELGDHNADWVEQALEWAQRICNGESWEALCNNDDTANYHRLVVWKNGYAHLVGGSRGCSNYFPSSGVSSNSFFSNDRTSHTVPLVVRYEK